MKEALGPTRGEDLAQQRSALCRQEQRSVPSITRQKELSLQELWQVTKVKALSACPKPPGVWLPPAVMINGSLRRRREGAHSCVMPRESKGGRIQPWSHGPQDEQLHQSGCGSGPAKWGVPKLTPSKGHHIDAAAGGD